MSQKNNNPPPKKKTKKKQQQQQQQQQQNKTKQNKQTNKNAKLYSNPLQAQPEEQDRKKCPSWGLIRSSTD